MKIEQRCDQCKFYELVNESNLGNVYWCKKNKYYTFSDKNCKNFEELMIATINLQLPNNIEIGGTVLPKEGSLTFDKEPNGKIDGAVLRINIESNVTLNGVPVSFKSQISHTLTKDEMDELMLKFKQ